MRTSWLHNCPICVVKTNNFLKNLNFYLKYKFYIHRHISSLLNIKNTDVFLTQLHCNYTVWGINHTFLTHWVKHYIHEHPLTSSSFPLSLRPNMPFLSSFSFVFGRKYGFHLVGQQHLRQLLLTQAPTVPVWKPPPLWSAFLIPPRL